MYATMVAAGNVALPDGCVLEGKAENVVVLPNGERFKFWVSVEMIQNEDGDPVEIDMDTQMLEERGMILEHDGTMVSLHDED